MSQSIPFELEHPGEPGRMLRGRVVIPDAVQHPIPWPWVLVLHGFKGFMDWGFFPHLAEQLAARGIAAVCFNASGSGIAEDLESFSDADGFFRDTLARQMEDVQLMRRAALGDVVFARAARNSRFSLDPERAGLFGHSRGGGVALLTASEAAGDWQALVSWAAVDKFARWSPEFAELWRRQGSVPIRNGRTGEELAMGVGFLEDYEANMERYNLIAACGRLRLPALLLHGSDDETVEPGALARLGSAAPSGFVQSQLIGGAGHTFGAVHPWQGPVPPLQAALSLTLDWFGAQLLQRPLRDGRESPHALD